VNRRRGCSKIAEAEAAVSVNEKKWLVMKEVVSDEKKWLVTQARLWLDEETVWGVSSSRTGDCVQLLTGSGCQPWRTWLPSECGCCSRCV
jgi:hypothetical protein